MKLPKQCGLVAAMTLALPGTFGIARAQTPPPAAGSPTTFFPFVIPWDDAAPGTATDMSYLNAKPAGVNGRIVVRDGHFVEAKTGTRVRFLGTNFTFNALFPTHSDAEKVAAHLAKMGINVVRIHHHDFDSGPLWDKTFKDHQHLDAEAMDRLDYLIYQFKRNGIYVDLNLHVSRQFTPEDGFPASVSEIKAEYDKRVDNYDRRMIALQKKFAHDYLTHVNAYTKLPYTDDPCVAMIEINNENSLVGNAGASLAAELEDLPEPFRGELVTLWNDWLTKRYKNDAALQTAWRFGAGTIAGPSLVNASAKWTLEDHGLGAALTPASDASTVPDAAPAVDVAGPKIDDQSWHIQAYVTGLDLKADSGYTVKFEAKADAPRTVTVYAGMDEADWHHVGLDATTHVGTEWKTYTLPFEAVNTVAGHSRLTFVFGNQVGRVSLRGVSIAPGVPASLATGGGTLAARTIDLPAAASSAERADWVHFLADTERGYTDEMRTYVKRDLKAKANVIGSQIEYGESAGLYREASSDFADGHAYWQHPHFPGKPWDPTDWTIQNTPMSSALATDGGTLLQLAEYRVAGKPFTVTEYNEPAPSDYQCETLPELASFAALQDWDSIFLFDWGSYGEAIGAENEKIQSYFGIGSNPAKTAFLPAAALIFRGGSLLPAIGTLALKIPENDILMGSSASTFWKQAQASPAHSLLESRLSISVAPTDDPHKLPTITRSDDKNGTLLRYAPISMDANHIAFSSKIATAVAGFVGGSIVKLGPADIEFASFGNNYCTCTLTPRKNAQSILLTIVGKVENNGMQWNTDRTSIGNHWGTGPSQAEFVPATITMTGSGATHVWALDGTGKRTKEIPVRRTTDSITFSTDPAVRTVWYEIVTVK